jgi:hypothetical protein
MKYMTQIVFLFSFACTQTYALEKRPAAPTGVRVVSPKAEPEKPANAAASYKDRVKGFSVDGKMIPITEKAGGLITSDFQVIESLSTGMKDGKSGPITVPVIVKSEGKIYLLMKNNGYESELTRSDYMVAISDHFDASNFKEYADASFGFVKTIAVRLTELNNQLNEVAAASLLNGGKMDAAGVEKIQKLANEIDETSKWAKKYWADHVKEFSVALNDQGDLVWNGKTIIRDYKTLTTDTSLRAKPVGFSAEEILNLQKTDMAYDLRSFFVVTPEVGIHSSTSVIGTPDNLSTNKVVFHSKEYKANPEKFPILPNLSGLNSLHSIEIVDEIVSPEAPRGSTNIWNFDLGERITNGKKVRSFFNESP